MKAAAAIERRLSSCLRELELFSNQAIAIHFISLKSKTPPDSDTTPNPRLPLVPTSWAMSPPHLVRLGLRSPTLRSLRSYSALTQKEIDPQLNGYPQLPDTSKQSLPPRGWWDNQMRRNFGDTVCQKTIPFSQRALCLLSTNVSRMNTKRSFPCGAPISLMSIPPPLCAISPSPPRALSRSACFASMPSCQNDLPSHVNILLMAS